jgi:hypothetical protein
MVFAPISERDCDMNTSIVWRVVTCATIAVIASTGAEFEHFTWWSIASLAFYGTLASVGIEVKYFWVALTIQIMVIGGVNVMGVTDCDVFETAFQSLGPTYYIIGNFIMHYLPSLIIVATASRKHVLCGEDVALKQIMVAFGIFLIWHHLWDPWAVYGCSLPHSLGLSGMLLLSLILSIIAMYIEPL